MESLKEKILFISPIVPRPDMNSGDLRLFSILEILSKKYEIVFVSTSHRDDDDSYVESLKQFGISVFWESFSLSNLLKTNLFKIAILEFYFIGEYYIDRIRMLQPECRIVVDSVDVHYLRHQLKYELTKDKDDYITFLKTKNTELSVYKKADAVITVTQNDASAILDEFSSINCEIVPNIHEIVPGNVEKENNSLIFVGGFSHPPNVDAVLHFCRDILPLIVAEKPDLSFTIVGSNPPEQIKKLEGENVRVTGYVPETSSYLHRSHVSVAPLRYGAGMKGKIGEAMAHGVPVVTTTVGAQGMGLTHGKDIMIADSPQCFAAAVFDLLNDPVLYKRVKLNAIQVIDDNFTPDRVGGAMLAALERICNKSAKRMSIKEKIVFVNSYICKRVKSLMASC